MLKKIAAVGTMLAIGLAALSSSSGANVSENTIASAKPKTDLVVFIAGSERIVGKTGTVASVEVNAGNYGPSTAPRVWVKYVVPAGLKVLSVTHSDAEGQGCRVASPGIVCSFTNQAAEDYIEIDARIRVPRKGPKFGKVIVGGNVEDYDMSYNTARFEVSNKLPRVPGY